MKATIKPLTQRPAWKALATHHKTIRNVHLRELFADDPKRGERLRAEAAGLYLDYSKNRITDQTLKLLVQLAKDSDLGGRITAMFSGEKINLTEHRAVLHVALRAPRGAQIFVDGKNVVPEVHAVLDKMTEFSNRVHSGEWKGHTGKRIKTVINIGIGGSDLGPVMAYEALKHYSERSLTFRFVSNVEGSDFVEATRDLAPAETMFIVSSKTFTTLEPICAYHTGSLLGGLAVLQARLALGHDAALEYVHADRHGHRHRRGHAKRGHHPREGRPARYCQGHPSQPRHHAEHSPEPVLRLSLQYTGHSGGGRGALSVLWPAAQPDHCRRRDEPEFRLGHQQRLATAEHQVVVIAERHPTIGG